MINEEAIGVTVGDEERVYLDQALRPQVVNPIKDVAHLPISYVGAVELRVFNLPVAEATAAEEARRDVASGSEQGVGADRRRARMPRSEEHTSELQSRQYLVCRLLLEKKKNISHSNLPSTEQSTSHT